VIQVTADPANPERVAVTATVTVYLDTVTLRALSDEIEKAIRAQAAKDLKSNPEVRKVIADAAQAKLLGMLGVGDAL
jgi:hypothetical protein